MSYTGESLGAHPKLEHFPGISLYVFPRRAATPPAADDTVDNEFRVQYVCECFHPNE